MSQLNAAWVKSRQDLARTQMQMPLIFGYYHYPDGRVAQLGTYFLDLCRHVHIIGMSGVGKSTMIANLITQSMDAGVGVFVLEPHHDLVADALARCPAEREKDVCLIDPSAKPKPSSPPPKDKTALYQWKLELICANRVPGLNILEAPLVANIPNVVSQCMSVFRKLIGASWDTSVRMQRLLQMGFTTLLYWRDDPTLDDFYQFLTQDDFRQMVLNAPGRGRNRYAERFWRDEFEEATNSDKRAMTGPVITRISKFLANPLVGNIVNQRRNTIDFWDLMNHSKIVLAPILQEMGEDVMQFLGSFLVIKMRSSGVVRTQLPQDGRPPFMTFIDECQNFIMPDLVQALAEDRKRGLGYFFAHQMASQMADGGKVNGASMLDALMGNVGSRIVFQVGLEDGAYFAKGLQGVESGDVRSLERFKAYTSLLVKAQQQPTCSMQTFPKPDERHDMQAVNEPPPKLDTNFEQANLALVHKIEALPTLAQQVENLKGLSDEAFSRFKAARRYRDISLRRQLLQKPHLVPHKTRRIEILSALKYATPIYEVDAEVERTAAQVVSSSDDEWGGW